MDPTLAGRSQLLIAELDKKAKEDITEDTLFVKIHANVLKIAYENKMFYPACKECNKRVKRERNGWYCDKCRKSFVDCGYVYHFTVKIGDFSQAIVAQVIGNNVGEAFFGITAEQLRQIQR